MRANSIFCIHSSVFLQKGYPQ
uniref:Uncharacterized protein n=1 Tax=Arundo donax TaxID=35708 RepID=A0A0A9AZ04_ARUDO